MIEAVPRRIRPGTRYKDFYNYPSKPYDVHREQILGISSWIDQNARENGVSDPDSTITPPGNPSPEDINLWKYEQVRYFCKELNWLCVELQGYCPPKKYPQMIATEQWIFLCAAHKTPKECAAVDYMRHTLDFVGNQLNDVKRFPSRISIKEVNVQKLSNICRRVYRIFAHAYYQHKSIYETFEKRTRLCERFTKFVCKYNLMTEGNLIVPCIGAPDDARAIEESENKSRQDKREQKAKLEAEKLAAIDQQTPLQAQQSNSSDTSEESTSEESSENKLETTVIEAIP